MPVMKPKFNDFVDLLHKKAANDPEKSAFILLNRQGETVSQLTYLKLHQRAQAIACYLAQACSSPARVLLLFPQGLAFVSAFSGTLYLGATAVPVRLPVGDQNMERFQAIIADADVHVVLTTASLADLIRQRADTYKALAGKKIVPVEDISDQWSEKWRPPKINPEEPAYLQYTSGTTGAPKGVMVSHANMLYQCEALKSAYLLSHRSRSLSWLPHFHYTGLVFGILQPLYSGFTGYLSSQDDFIAHPFGWLQAISKYRITCSGGPDFSYAQCIEQVTHMQKKCLDLSCWEIAWNGAEPVRKETMADFYRSFKSCGLKQSALMPCYGLTEAALPVTGRDDPHNPICIAVDPETLGCRNSAPSDQNATRKSELVCCGRPFLDTQVITVDPQNGTACNDLEPGEIWVRSKGCAMGYWRRPTQSKATFEAALQGDDTGSWLRTGDWGFIDKGQLYVAGRLKSTADVCHTANSVTSTSHPPANQRLIAPATHSGIRPVAVIGMAGTFPQSDTCEQFWDNIAAGSNLISEIPSERWDWKKIYGTPDNASARTHIKWGGFINDMAAFDAAFFNISPKEAQYMDPMQRKMLQVVWQTVEDAGYRMSNLSGCKVGVFIGMSTFDYLQLMMENQAFVHAYASTGILHCMAPNRISYLFNFTGPSEAVDTACSSSLVALHRAVTSLQKGECELAIVGGANAMISSSVYVTLSNANMLSEDGKCKTFDAAADGYVRGEGIGAILLKPMSRAREDKDYVYGTIRGTAENHSGHTNSLTAPNPFAQADVITRALHQANIDPGTINYIETHGTGTSLGDPIEINGLKMAFAKSAATAFGPGRPPAYCGLGTVKTNIGHLEAAAGIAGVVKVLMAMKHKQIPAHLHFKTLNPNIDLKASPFYIVDGTTRVWEALQDDNGQPLPRRAGVSSFGFGGVNAHVVIEENTAAPLRAKPFAGGSPQLFTLSARTEAQLLRYGRRMAAFLKRRNERVRLAHLIYTLQVGREPMAVRLAIVADDLNDLIAKLDDFLIDQKLAVQVYPDTVFHDSIKPDLARIMFDSNDTDGQQLLDQFFHQNDLFHLAQLWLLGVDLKWEVLYREKAHRHRIPLPTYPFEKENHWIPLRPAGRDGDERNTGVPNAKDIFNVQWVEAVKTSTDLDEDPAQTVQFILLCDQQGVSKAFADLLEKNGLSYHKVFYDKNSAAQTAQAHAIDPFAKASYQNVLDTIRNQSKGRQNYILNFWPLDHSATADYSLADISDATHFTCATALNLIQALITDEAKSKDHVWFICANLQPVEDPGPLNLKSAALWGLAKTMLLEHHDIFQAIIDVGSSDTVDTAAALLHEVLGYDNEGEIVYRNQKRFVARLLASSIQPQTPLKVKKDGTYLITGGLGTLGLQAARWLSEHKAGRVLLLSRNGLDPERTDRLSQTKQELLAAIQASGTQVQILLADVADRDEMEKACKPYLEAGEIRGIFHAAGAFQSNLIKDMIYDDFLKVIAAKIQGTWILHEMTQGQPLDYFVMYSSAASIWGAATGAHYGAANYFLDLYAHYCTALGLPATSVNWGGMWKGSGIITGEDEKYMRSIGIKDMLPDTGLQLLEAILQSGDRQKVVAPVKWSKFLQVMQVKRKHMLFEYIDPDDTSVNTCAENAESFGEELASLSEADKITTAVAALSGMLKEILGLQSDADLPVDKGFFDLGMDSLTSIDFKNKIEINLDIEISTTTLFDSNTLQLLAGHVIRTHFAGDSQNLETDPPKTADTSATEENVLDQYDKENLLEALKLEMDMAESA